MQAAKVLGVIAGASVFSMAIAGSPVSLGCHKTKGHNVQCKYNTVISGKKMDLYAQTAMPFALCSKALCKPNPNHKNIVTCTCPVYGWAWQGVSVGPKSFKHSKPTYHHHGLLKTVTSNFAMANLSSFSQKPTTCQNKAKKLPWANCFGIRCKVHYKNGEPVAICKCPVDYNKSFISVGPKNKSDCHKGNLVWSGALASQSQSNGVIMPAMYKHFFNKTH